MGRHALLSASSSHRWLACPLSARLCEDYEDTGSEYAQQGTDAHSLCEHKLKLALGMETTDPTEGLSFYDEEMEECACGYIQIPFNADEINLIYQFGEQSKAETCKADDDCEE